MFFFTILVVMWLAVGGFTAYVAGYFPSFLRRKNSAVTLVGCAGEILMGWL